MMAVDNLCWLAVIGKARTSSRALKRASRKIAAICLSTGIRLVLRWVPSKRNVADGPSRGRMLVTLEADDADEMLEPEREHYWEILQRTLDALPEFFHGFQRPPPEGALDDP